MKYLTEKQILQLHAQIIEQSGGTPELRDMRLLNSALNAPFQTYDGNELYPNILAKAAQLCFGLINNHPFVDGNKRIAAHAMFVFLDINNIELAYSDDEVTVLILSVAAGKKSMLNILHWLQNHIK